MYISPTKVKSQRSFVYINNCPFHHSSKVLPLPLSMAVIYEHAQTHWAHYVQPEGS